MDFAPRFDPKSTRVHHKDNRSLSTLHSAKQQLVVQPSHLHRQNLLNAALSLNSKTESDRLPKAQKVKCQRYLDQKSVKLRQVLFQNRQVSNTLTPSEGVSPLDEMPDACAGIGDLIVAIQVTPFRLVRSDPFFRSTTSRFYCGCLIPRSTANELFQLSDSLCSLPGRLIPRLEERCSVFKELTLPCRELLFTEIMPLTQFCLLTFTAECLKNNCCFKLGSVSSSFRHRNFPFNKIVIVSQFCFRGWSKFPVAVQHFEDFRTSL